MDLELLVKDDLKLVYAAMNKLKLQGCDDAYAIGCEALYKAALSFDHERGVKFGTYAYVCIYNALGMHIRRVVRDRDMNMLYYDAPTSADSSLVNILPGGKDIEEIVLEKEKIQFIKKALNDYINSRTSAQQKLIISKWVKSGFRSKTVDIAEQVNVSQGYVSVVIKNTRAYLKKRLEVEYNGRGRI